MKTLKSGIPASRLLCFLAAVLLVPVVSLAAEHPKKSGDPYATVASADLFAMGAVGYAGTTTEAEKCLQQIVKQKDGADLCRKLIQEKNPAAQLYGLLGLKILDGKAFADAYPKFKQSKIQVKTASGCELFNETVAGLAKDIKDRPSR
jgi:hypothetical protein